MSPTPIGLYSSSIFFQEEKRGICDMLGLLECGIGNIGTSPKNDGVDDDALSLCPASSCRSLQKGVPICLVHNNPYKRHRAVLQAEFREYVPVVDPCTISTRRTILESVCDRLATSQWLKLIFCYPECSV